MDLALRDIDEVNKTQNTCVTCVVLCKLIGLCFVSSKMDTTALVGYDLGDTHVVWFISMFYLLHGNINENDTSWQTADDFKWIERNR
jgi:hypothetical protein